ncbi:M15 family metallopeptidase [Methylobacterium sp. SI9]|uniref:M15 family metallopeptidase n=1 Tax=Methylobacterium guangdongense TaxID=3138811 RepID=UPI00313F20DE
MIDKRYATTSNFAGTAFEQGIDYVCLHQIAAAKLKNASRLLESRRPGYRLVIFDALRTVSQQKTIWNIVKGTDRARYVADPRKGSIHSFGFAVDLSIVDRQGKALDMGTDFDSFTARAEPRRETELLKSGQLTRHQVVDRRLLRDVMRKAGFEPLSIEWWHYDALPPQLVRSRYRQLP